MREFGECAAGRPIQERPGAYALALDEEGRIAVLQTPEGIYLPGGGLEAGESPEEALRREVLEETGHMLNLRGKVCEAFQHVSSPEHPTCLHNIGYFFKAIFGEKWQDPTEADHKMMWLPRSEARYCLTHHFQAWAVSQVAKG